MNIEPHPLDHLYEAGVKNGYKNGHAAGYRAGLEAAAKVCDQVAGGRWAGAIESADRIRKLPTKP